MASSTPMFDKLRKMNSTTPAVQLMKTTAETVRKQKAAATGTPYKVNQTAVSTPQSPVYGTYTGKVSDSYVPGTLGNQKVGASSGGDPTPPPPPQTPPPPTPDTSLDPLGLLNDYKDEQSRLALDNLRAAFDQQRTDLNAQKPAIQQEVSDAKNTVDTNYYQSLPELYKAMESGGQRGGENITGMVGLNSVRGQGQNAADLYGMNQTRNIENALLGLDSQETQATSQAQMGINSDVLTQQLSALKDAMAAQTAERTQEKGDFTNTIGAYSDDYMKEINNLRAQGVPDTDYRILALLSARNQKKADLAAAAAEASQNADANNLAWYKAYNSGSNSGGSSLTYEQALALYQSGDRSSSVLSALGIK